MNISKFIIQNLTKINDSIKSSMSISKSVKNDVILINNKRLYSTALIAMAINLVHIVLFYNGLSSGSANEIKWRTGVIICHIIMFVVFGLLGFSAYSLRNRENMYSWMKLVQNTVIIFVLIMGISLVTIDQLVTQSISPFIIMIVISTLIYIMRPLMSIPIYVSIYLVYYFAIAITQTKPDILLTNRVNGIAAIGIGISMSLILWKYNTSNIIYKRTIEEQKKVLEEKNRELEHIAFYDMLTNLYNRRSFEKILVNEASLISRYKHESCLVLLDIDFFKKINDNYGHPVGDLVLQEIASVLVQNTRETDKISRWGGEEFLILLPHTKISEGKQIAEKLRKFIENIILIVNANKICITASFGVAELNADNYSLLDLTYKYVDEALYLAKSKGRNHVEVA